MKFLMLALFSALYMSSVALAAESKPCHYKGKTLAFSTEGALTSEKKSSARVFGTEVKGNKTKGF